VRTRDGVRDRVDCGAGRDLLVADALDIVLVGSCERVDRPGRDRDEPRRA
jgi:hypothetical protein